MANMSYCRFQNTLPDLRDCQEAMDDADLSPEESQARERLLLLCEQIASDFADEIEDIHASRIALRSKGGA